MEQSGGDVSTTILPPGAEEMVIRLGAVSLPGLLSYPENPCGLVLFAHGSGSSRLSVRNNLVAAELRAGGLGTLLFDLLTDEESRFRTNVFDIPLLADRLLGASTWIRKFESDLPLGFFGASTGAAAALVAAAALGTTVRAVVSRGGRPDLAMEALPEVTAPTLLIVGGNDHDVMDLNQEAYGRLRCRKRLAIVPGAGHLFEEKGALDEVASLAQHWFVTYLPAAPLHSRG
jgi:putative phosphoribosyl transferase